MLGTTKKKNYLQCREKALKKNIQKRKKFQNKFIELLMKNRIKVRG